MKIIKKYAIPFFFLALLAASVYGGTLNYPFVFDDDDVVVTNPTLRHISSIPRFFTTLGPGGENDITGLYRPMVFATFTLNFLVSGLNPLPYRLFDVLLHIVNSFLLFLVIAELQKLMKNENRVVALLFAALFCVHPVLTQPVIYISARSVLIMTFFCLSSLLSYVKYRVTDKAPLLAVSAFLFVCALLTKESAPPFTGVIILMEFYFHKRNRVSLKAAILRIVPFAAAAAIFVTIRAYFLSKAAKTLLVDSYLAHWLAEISAVPRYILVILDPSRLCAVHEVPNVQLNDPNLWAGAGIITAVLLLIYILSRKDVLLACLLAWPFLAMLPEMILPVPERMVEYRLYLPMAGLTAFFSGAYSKWSAGFSRPIMRASTAILVVCLAISGFFAYKAEKVWASPITLWQDATNKYPSSFRSHYNLGNAYWKRGYNLKSNVMVYMAINEYQLALKIWPDFADAHNNLGTAYFYNGLVDEAIDEFEVVLKIRPDDADAHYNLGLALLKKGLIKEAIMELGCAARLKPEDPEIRKELGAAITRAGMTGNTRK